MITWFQSANPQILFWLVLLIVFVVGELISVGLTSIWFAAGSLAALIVAAAGGNLAVQIVVFFAVSIVLLAATRPFAKRVINSNTHKTNADQIIGEEIIIRERVSNLNQTGMAVVNGQEWTVRTESDKEIIEQGEFARVIRISGVKLIVEKAETKNKEE